jgi:hypothetical protein
MILISAQDSPELEIHDLSTFRAYIMDHRVWLREPVVLNIAIHQGVVVCATGGSHTDWHISVLR